MKGKIVTEEERLKVITLYLSGMNQKECAQKLNRSQCFVRNVLLKENIQIRTFSSIFGVTPDIEKLIIEEYKKGYTTYQCADKFNITQSTINRIFKRNNFKSRGYLGGKRIFNINENFFDNIDNKEKTYWLGWIYSDGYITAKGFGLSLTLSDSYILNILKDLIEYEGKLLIKKPNKTSKEAKSLIITSKKLKKSLELLGLKRNKSLTLKFPTYIPNNLINHFIRGLIEGDGCVYTDINNKTTISYTGTYDMCLGVQKEFEKIGVKSNKIYNNKNIYSISYTNKEALIKIYNFLYKNTDNLKLIRKELKLKNAITK